MTDRVKAIDYIKCIACLLIINSHIAQLYPDSIKALSFGGYFGNSFFFFVSGYCLNNLKEDFPRWYYKRFWRIYTPYMIMIPLLFFDHRLSIQDGILNIIMPYKLYHFIPTILIWYAVYYLVVHFDKKGFNYKFVILIFTVVSFLYFYFLFDYENSDIYDHFTFLEMNSYFLVMLLGYGVYKHGPLKKSISIVISVLCFSLYMYQSVFGFPKVFSLYQLIIGIGFAYGISNLLIGVESKLKSISIITLISSVTLEAYIVHYICRDAFVSIGFPTNLLFFIVSVMEIGYCLHWLSVRLSKIITNKGLRI